jgi:hypothetical protein
MLLLRHEVKNVPQVVATDTAEMREVERVTREQLGLSLTVSASSRSAPGALATARILRSPEAVGTDTNIVPRGIDPAAWLTMVRQNGWLRSAKTLARRSLLLDER